MPGALRLGHVRRLPLSVDRVGPAQPAPAVPDARRERAECDVARVPVAHGPHEVPAPEVQAERFIRNLAHGGDGIAAAGPLKARRQHGHRSGLNETEERRRAPLLVLGGVFDATRTVASTS